MKLSHVVGVRPYKLLYSYTPYLSINICGGDGGADCGDALVRRDANYVPVLRGTSESRTMRCNAYTGVPRAPCSSRGCAGLRDVSH